MELITCINSKIEKKKTVGCELMSSWPCKNTGQPVALGNLFCVCRAYLSLCQNSTQSPVWRVTAPSRTKQQRSTCPAQTCGNAPFFHICWGILLTQSNFRGTLLCNKRAADWRADVKRKRCIPLIFRPTRELQTPRDVSPRHKDSVTDDQSQFRHGS